MQSVLDEIEQVVKVNILDTINMRGFRRAASLAEGMTRLRDIMSRPEVMAMFMKLQNSPLGFQTDKPEGGYPVEVVRDALIEGFLRGALPVNNEINIIAGRCYLTKNYFVRVTAEFPGVVDLVYECGVPSMSPNGALVPFRARWVQDGEERTIIKLNDEATKTDFRIAVKVNSGMGADGILGKATRKGLKLVYERMTGNKIDLPDGDIAEPQSTPTGHSRVDRAIGAAKVATGAA